MTTDPLHVDVEQEVPVLQLVGIRKSFNVGQANENEILHGIDLTLRAGEFCAVENVMMPMFGDLGFANAEMKKRAVELLDTVGLTPWLHTQSSHLSGGQQQRVAVARALVMQPALILADEPTGNLDSKSADAVFELLRKVCKDQHTAVLFVTHNPLLSARCDRIIQVIDGLVTG